MLSKWSDLNAALSDLDRAGEAFIVRLSQDAEALSFSAVDKELSTRIADRLRDSMVLSHLRAKAIWTPTRDISCAVDSKEKSIRLALRDANKRERSALSEFYDSIARSATTQAMSRVRQTLAADVVAAAKGEPVDAKKSLRALGISVGKRASPLVKTLLRTQTSMAFNTSAWASAQEAGDELWGYEYTTASDERVRASHQAIGGTRYPKDHPFWERYAPPNGWNCRCGLDPVFRRQRGRARTVPFRGRPEVDPSFQFNAGKIFSAAT